VSEVAFSMDGQRTQYVLPGLFRWQVCSDLIGRIFGLEVIFCSSSQYYSGVSMHAKSKEPVSGYVLHFSMCGYLVWRPGGGTCSRFPYCEQLTELRPTHSDHSLLLGATESGFGGSFRVERSWKPLGRKVLSVCR
jgi:hypothetical protein